MFLPIPAFCGVGLLGFAAAAAVRGLVPIHAGLFGLLSLLLDSRTDVACTCVGMIYVCSMLWALSCLGPSWVGPLCAC